jgi:ankyrin repeat protein
VNDLDQFGSTPLILAAQRDWAQVVKELLQRDVDPNHQNLFGSTALRPGGCWKNFWLMA